MIAGRNEYNEAYAIMPIWYEDIDHVNWIDQGKGLALEMQKVTNWQALSDRRDTKTMIQMGKYKRVQMHSMKARLDEPVLEKLKSSSFAYRRKKQQQRLHQTDLSTKRAYAANSY